VPAVFATKEKLNLTDMNINKKNTDELNAILSIKLEKSDYETRVEKMLEDYRKKARIDGFRPGKVPMGIIHKMYYKPVLIEEMNKLVSEYLSDYLLKEKLNILGEPLPHINDSKKIDWDHDTEFEFKFDLGMVPEFEVKIAPRDKYPYYFIKVDDTMMEKYIDSYRERFGELISVDTIGEKDLLKVNLQQLNSDNNPPEGGIVANDVTISVDLVKDASIKSELLKMKKEGTLIIDLKKAYPNNVELAGMLKIEKEKAAALSGDFLLQITDISHFRPAEVNQELFDKIYGPGKINSEQEFRLKITEDASNVLKKDSEYRFRLDVKETLIKKTKFDLPAEFLKRWLLEINEGKFTAEQIEKDYSHFEEDLRWQLIKDKISSDNQLEVTDEDMKAVAKETARAQFGQYGMYNVPEDHIEEFAHRMLERKEDKNNIKAKVVDNKVIDFIKGTVKLDEKEISSEKFNKLFEK
jgi:trigger factor